MKMKLIVISSLLFLASCSEVVEFNTLKTIDVFESQEENMQLGRSLFAYDYSSGLRELLPQLSHKDLSNVAWELFVREKDKEVLFRLKLNVSNDLIRDNKEKITSFFNEELSRIINEHLAKRNIIRGAIDKVGLYFELMDRGNYSELVGEFDENLIKEKEVSWHIERMEKKAASLGKLKERNLNYVYVSDEKGVDIYMVIFKSEYSNIIMQEFFTLGKKASSGKWYIYGYGSRRCDATCTFL